MVPTRHPKRVGCRKISIASSGIIVTQLLAESFHYVRLTSTYNTQIGHTFRFPFMRAANLRFCKLYVHFLGSKDSHILNPQK
jgi:hypothetical protein